ncbi:ATP-binding response regulator [Solimonas soli]|uniref:ATP-binding response regulator n=1 Tax=Solimonas soli TaxID=413479 RepID=UPI0004836985|nr:ATP-binding protein [Solimonas soli]
MRVLLLAPTVKDAALTCQAFAPHGVSVVACADIEDLRAELDAGAGALLLAEEALPRQQPLAQWLDRQPAWSDLPVLVLARPNTDSTALARATQRLGNVTILVRPTRVAALVSAVQAALRARGRQYQIRQHLVERAEVEERLRLNDQRKDEFVAILAHELRNPLAPISNALHILKPWLARDEKMARFGQMMLRQLGNLTRLVNDLLEVSRVTRGELDLHRQRIDVATVVRTAVESSQPLIDAQRHQLSVTLPSSPVYLDADPMRLAQVLSNLLNNAAKYTLGNGHIALAVRVEGAQVAIEVQDDGMGIPPEDQARIFELFMQVPQNRTRAQGGLGIGLTLVKRLTELHGGSVEVASAGRDQGSRFTVRLPLAPAPDAAAADDDRAAEPDLSFLRALIADDNRDAADSLGLLLQRFGASVDIAYSGAQALGAADPRRINVAILDVGMPDISGLEVARRIRAQAEGQALRLIALTGWGQRHDILDTRAAGFDHHLTKPVDIAALVELLSRVRPPAA